MARRGENIYKRKDGRWEGRYIIERKPDGKPRFHSVYAKSYTAVKELLILRKGGHIALLTPAARKHEELFSDWADYWLQHVAYPSVRLSTYEHYRRNIETHLKPQFGNCYLREITEEAVKGIVRQWQTSLAPGTVQGIIRLFKSVMKSARLKGLCECRFEDLRIPGKIKKPRVLSIPEQQRMEMAMGPEGMEYMLCLYTGLRLGELCALKWEDVDLDVGYLFVRGTLQRVRGNSKKTYLTIGLPKSGASEREIPIPAFLLKRLRAWKEKSAGIFVFQGKNGRPMDPRTLQGRFKRFTGRLGIKGAHMHTLRHTFACRCLERGIGYDVLCELMGHSSAQITLKYYAHCTREQMRQSIEKLRVLAPKHKAS